MNIIKTSIMGRFKVEGQDRLVEEVFCKGKTPYYVVQEFCSAEELKERIDHICVMAKRELEREVGDRLVPRLFQVRLVTTDDGEIGVDFKGFAFESGVEDSARRDDLKAKLAQINSLYPDLVQEMADSNKDLIS